MQHIKSEPKNKGAKKAPLFTTYSTNTLTERLALIAPFFIAVELELLLYSQLAFDLHFVACD